MFALLATTTAVAQFYQRGELPLGTIYLGTCQLWQVLLIRLSADTPIMQILGKDYAQQGKGGITVRHCLLHNSGYPADPNPNYCT